MAQAVKYERQAFTPRAEVCDVSKPDGAAGCSPFMFHMPEGRPIPRIEAMTDRGPIVEIIVQCPAGTGIMTYSRMEKRFCPRGCDRSPMPMTLGGSKAAFADQDAERLSPCACREALRPPLREHDAAY